MIGKKIKGIIKVAAASIALCGGIISELIGVPLLCVGIKGYKNVLKDYEQTEEYQVEKAEVDERLGYFEERVAQAEEKYKHGEMTTDEYKQLKADLDKEKTYAYSNLAEESIEKNDNQEYKALLKQEDIKVYVGLGFMSLGALVYIIKGVESFANDGSIIQAFFADTIKSGVEDIKYVEPPRDFSQDCRTQDDENIEDCFKY